MDIAFFNWRDIKNPSAGGAEVYTHEIMKRLVEKGHRVTLFASSFPGCEEKEILDGVEHIRYGSKYLIYPKSYSCYKKYIKGKYDLIVESINGVPFFTKTFSKEKVVPFIHQLTRENWYSGLFFPLALVGYHLEDHFLRIYREQPTIVPSRSTKSDLEALGFKYVSVINGASKIRNPVGGKEKTKTIIYLGRLTKSKRVDHVINVFKKVKDFLPDAQLWIVGSGPEENHLKDLSKDLGIKFFGWVSEEEKESLLSRAHLMLFPAVREGWGLVVLEANACGTPVIGYDVPGLRDSIRPGKNGYLIEEGNVDSMAARAVCLLKDEKLLRTLSLNSLDYSKGFSWDTAAAEFYSFLEKVLE